MRQAFELGQSFLSLVRLIETPHHHIEDIRPIEHDPHGGLHPALSALILGILSGASLPIGSLLGYWLSPVKALFVALMMAFGAGALLFAVTVELYGHSLSQVAAGHMGLMEIYMSIFGALCGAAFYLTSNKWLNEYFSNGEHPVCVGTLPNGEECRHVFDMEDSQFCRVCGADRPDDGHSGGLMSELRKERPECECGHIFDRKDSAFCRQCGRPRPEQEEEEDDSLMEELRKQRLAASQKQFQGAEGEKPSTSLKDKFKRAGSAVIKVQKEARAVRFMKADDLRRVRSREKAIRAAHDGEHAKSVAFALFLGLLVDGVPEGVLMGFLSAEGHLTPVFIISLFMANFPEAFSSTSLLVQAEVAFWKIFAMWTFLCLLVGSLCGMSCYLLLLWFPNYGDAGGHGSLPMEVRIGISLVEGITGGAMIACIAAVMLPEAFESAGKHGTAHGVGHFWQQSGFMCTVGFLVSVSLKALFG